MQLIARSQSLNASVRDAEELPVQQTTKGHSWLDAGYAVVALRSLADAVARGGFVVAVNGAALVPGG